MKRSSTTWLWVIGSFSAILITLGSYKFWQISEVIAAFAAYPEPVETVVLAVPEPIGWRTSITAPAEVLAIQDVQLRTELPGRIVTVGFLPGARVETGQLLLQLDTREELAELQAAQADAQLARLALRRNRRLAQSGAASAEALDQASALYNSTRARVSGLQAIIDKKTLRAPFDGIAGLHQLAVGQYLDASTVLTRLIGTDQGLWIDFNLPQHQANLAIGDSVTVSAPRLLSADIEARVIARDAWVDAASRNVRYRALLSAGAGAPAFDRESNLYPGAIVSVNIELGDTLPAVAIPATSVQRDPYGPFVFTLQPAEEGAGAAHRAQRRPVVLAGIRGVQAIVTEGLQDGELLAGDGAFKLRENVLVNAISPTGDNGVGVE